MILPRRGADYNCGVGGDDAVNRDTFDLPQNPGSDMWAQCLRGHQLDLSTKELLKEERNIHEVVERVFVRCEFHKDINVARRSLLPTNERTKQANACDSQ